MAEGANQGVVFLVVVFLAAVLQAVVFQGVVCWEGGFQVEVCQVVAYLAAAYLEAACQGQLGGILGVPVVVGHDQTLGGKVHQASVGKAQGHNLARPWVALGASVVEA